MKPFPVSLLTIAVLLLSLPGVAQSTGDELEQRRSGAQQVTQRLFDQLSSELREAMEQGGPAEAIRVCRDRAPGIKSRLSRETGWRITRVGTRVRNPLLGMPDEYEAEILDRFAMMRAEGTPVGDLEHASVETSGERRYFRYLKGIGVQEQCLSCHGAAEERPKAIKDQLSEQYPHDQAVDYEVGDLRGAFSIIQNMDKPYATP